MNKTIQQKSKSKFSMGSFHFQGEMRSNSSYPKSKLSGSKFHFHGVGLRGGDIASNSQGMKTVVCLVQNN